MSQYCKGGQYRTCNLPCGYTIRKHPREVNGIVKIHMKNCKVCQDALNGNKLEVPEFNKAVGMLNGWGGLDKRGNTSHNYMATTFNMTTGEEHLLGCESNSISNCLEEINDKSEERKLMKSITKYIQAPIEVKVKCYWCNKTGCDGFQELEGLTKFEVHKTCM